MITNHDTSKNIFGYQMGTQLLGTRKVAPAQGFKTVPKIWVPKYTEKHLFIFLLGTRKYRPALGKVNI